MRRAATAFSHAAAAPAATASLAKRLALVGMLPMFAQTFHYMNEYPIPYAMSKAWPFLTLPLALYAMIRMALPVAWVFLLVLSYTIGFTPLVSMIQLGNGFSDALTTTVKVWPITYYFSLSAMLALLAIRPDSVRRMVLGYGIATFTVMVLLFVAAPKSWYTSSAAGGKLLMYEIERGYRVYMPMFFGLILTFWLARSAVMKRSIIHGIGVGLTFMPLIFVYKQRIAIAAAAVTALFAMVMSLPPRMRRLAFGVAMVMTVVVGIYADQKIGIISEKPTSDLQESLGGSLTVRQKSLGQAFGFLGSDPLRWAFGVGATTRFSVVTINEIFGNHQFFIADLGWVGIIFEYGVVGAALLAALYISCLFYISRIARNTGDPFAHALGDLVLYVVLSSSVYSVVFTPGETAVATAIAVYLDRCRRAAAVPSTAGVPASFRPGAGHHVRLGRAITPERTP